MVAWNIPVENANSSSRSATSTGATVHQPAVPGMESSSDKEMVSSSPVSDVVTDEAIVSVKEETHELGSAAEKPTTNEAVVTTRSPTIHSPTVRVTTAQASSTVRLIEPTSHSSSAPGVSKEIFDPNFTTLSEEDIASLTTTIPPKGVDPIHEKEILPTEEGSGEPVRINRFNLKCSSFPSLQCPSPTSQMECSNLIPLHVKLV